jgi:hypothetical protein
MADRQRMHSASSPPPQYPEADEQQRRRHQPPRQPRHTTAAAAASVHEGVMCSRCGKLPIVGTCYRSRGTWSEEAAGQGFSLCEACYLRESERERAGFAAVP